MIHFTANIEPMGAVRMTGRGKFVKGTAQRYLAYKQYLAHIARTSIKEPVHGPIRVNVRFYYPIPASFPKYKRGLALQRMIVPTVKPDIDNCIKGVFDALNKIAWNDDNQVARVVSEKWYSDEPRIEVDISPMTFDEVSA